MQYRVYYQQSDHRPYVAPAFDASVPQPVMHYDGTHTPKVTR